MKSINECKKETYKMCALKIFIKIYLYDYLNYHIYVLIRTKYRQSTQRSNEVYDLIYFSL